MQGAARAVINIEGNSKLLKSIMDLVVVFIYDFLWAYSFLFGAKGDGGSVFIATTNKEHIGTFEAQKSGENVCR